MDLALAASSFMVIPGILALVVAAVVLAQSPARREPGREGMRLQLPSHKARLGIAQAGGLSLCIPRPPLKQTEMGYESPH